MRPASSGGSRVLEGERGSASEEELCVLDRLDQVLVWSVSLLS